MKMGELITRKYRICLLALSSLLFPFPTTIKINRPNFQFSLFLTISIFGFLEWNEREAGERNKEEGMELEFYQELFLTAVISILFAFLLGKIAGGGHGEGERPVDDLASSYVTNSGENLRRQVDEGFREAADVFGIGEQLRGSKREIVGVEELSGGITLVQESVEEKRALLDKVGEEEEISEKMPESTDIEGVSTNDFKEGAKDLIEEEKDVEEKEASSSSSDVKIVHGQWTEFGSDAGEDVIAENKGVSLLHGEDEWEGIERSDLEKLFGVAAEYSASIPGSMALARLSSDVQMELYGFHKIATEGPCYESQPLSLKVSARARWYCS